MEVGGVSDFASMEFSQAEANGEAGNIFLLPEYLQMAQADRTRVGEELFEKIEGCGQIYEAYFRRTHIAFILLAKELLCEKVCGYQVFFVNSTTKQCILFDVHIIQLQRGNKFGSGLIKRSIDWCLTKNIKDFKITLVSTKDRLSVLDAFCEKLRIAYSPVCHLQIERTNLSAFE